MIENIDNSNLFFKIFRNKYLKFEIFKHLRKYLKFLKLIKFNSVEQYKSFQEKEYLSKVYYDFKGFESLGNSMEYLKLGDNFWIHNLFITNGINILQKFLPQSLTHLELSNSFSRYLNLNGCKFLPESITILDIGDGFNRNINSNDIPSTLKSLIIGKNFKSSLNLKDCINLEKLIFNEKSHFNNELTNSNEINNNNNKNKNIIEINELPCNLKFLEFGNLYSREINANLNLPKTLTQLTFGSNFNNSIKFESLINLEYLKLGDGFDCEINIGDLPINLKTLIFGIGYKKKLKIGSLPSSLIYLSMDGYTLDFEVGVLSSLVNLLTLELSSFKTLSIPTNQNFKIGALPSSIQKFIFNEYFNTIYPFQSGSLPSSLTSLNLGFYNHTINEFLIPESLTSLILPQNINNGKTLFPKLFSNLKNLKFLKISYKNDILPNVLPNSLTSLTIESLCKGDSFETLPFEIFPRSLLHLSIYQYKKNYYSIEFIKPGDLPPSLKSLTIVSNLLNYQFQVDSIPQTLEKLDISNTQHKQEFLETSFLKSIKQLLLPKNYSGKIYEVSLINLFE
ncbi:hypothetical protein RB653_000131 [Dictyostelium firmibasis]|uniref:FNIP repeat-containing protein n=1 Tax=Dictyostelium firmibasis TaxID=79012 RepID=A0AAN7U296_9MYCE